MTLKAYMIFSRGAGPKEGAVLVFAHTSQEARRLGAPQMADWFDSDWTDVGTRWMPVSTAWLAEQEGIDLRGEPRVIESPQACERCDLWGSGPLDADGICEACREDEEIDRALS